MKKLPVIIALAACIMIFSVSCTVNNGDNTNPQSGYFLVSNVSPNAPALTVYVNSSLLGSGLSYGNYTQYYQANAGSYTFSFFDSSSTSTPRLSNTVTISPTLTYSYFVIDSFNKVKSSFVQDAFPAPPSDSVYIRFFNFSPNAGALTLADQTNAVDLYSTRTFNDQEGSAIRVAFDRMKAGIYDLVLKQPDGTVLASRKDTLSGAHVYTLFAKGFAGGTGVQALSIGQQLNY